MSPVNLIIESWRSEPEAWEFVKIGPWVERWIKRRDGRGIRVKVDGWRICGPGEAEFYPSYWDRKRIEKEANRLAGCLASQALRETERSRP